MVRLVVGSTRSFDAELIGDLVSLADLLGVGVISEWPPIGGEHDHDAVSYFRNALADDPGAAEWLAYYVVAGTTLVGSAGFMGPPVDGLAEIGYSICQMHRRQGLATQAVRALITLASQAAVRTIVAQTAPDNRASIATLQRCGFMGTPAHAGGQLRFELHLT